MAIGNAGISLPKTMYVNGVEIDKTEVQDKFAEIFNKKLSELASQVEIDKNVYNGAYKLNAQNNMFMGSM